MKVLISSDAIAKRVSEMAGTLAVDYYRKELIVISVLKGAFMFTADLVRAMHNPAVMIDFVKVSSYSGTLSIGVVKLDHLPLLDIHGKHVLVVEDIVDTGKTCSVIRDSLFVGGPASMKFCTLLDKPTRRVVNFRPDYVGFTIPNKFVVGFGLDYNGKYRNLADIYTFEED